MSCVIFHEEILPVNMELLLMAKITPSLNTCKCRARAAQFSACQTHLLVIDYGLNETEVLQCVYARSPFCKHIFKRDMNDSLFKLPALKVFLICFYFWQFQPVCSDRACRYKKVCNLLGSCSGTRFFYQPLQLLRVEVTKF